MSIYKKYVWIVFLLLLQKADAKYMLPPDAVIINSPDGTIAFTVTALNGSLAYAVTYRKVPVIETSPLGLTVNNNRYGEGISLGKVQRSKLREDYAYRGVHSKVSSEYTKAIINVDGTNSFLLECRIYNDGVAFKYVVNNKGDALIEKETTAFIIPAGCIIWSQPNFKYYEGKYGRRLIDTLSNGTYIGPPATIELPTNAGFAAITEGGLTDFAGMSLVVNGTRSLQANLTGNTKKTGTVETPWRIIEIGKDLNTLVNCDIIANVSPAYDPKLFPDGYNTSWVKPGRSVWSWLAGRGPVTLENMKKFTDLASELGFEYNLVDEGWGNWKDSVNHRDHWDIMKELVDYSAAKGVKIWVWKAYPNRRGIPGIKESAQRKTFFKKCKELGIAGLKVDFFDNEAQDIIQFYQAALRDAAEYHLMLNFHGANKPTGETRTWPNEMTREAIRGMENRPPWAASNTVLPFTRYLAGHADYTPVHFGDRLGDVTWAHHVASMAIFTSPFLCLGADPKSILDNPCKPMMQSISPVWDETVVLPESKIGEMVVYARRKGSTWFLAVMSSSKAVTITPNLAFLGKGKYSASLVSDDNAKQASAIFKSLEVTAATKLSVELNVNGGFIARFDKAVASK